MTAPAQPQLFLFDMDRTIVDNDCDVSWKKFLIAKGLAPAAAMDIADAFYQDYLRGGLDVDAFLCFQLAEFKGRSVAEMESLSDEHFEAIVADKIFPAAKEKVRAAVESGKPTAILTSTNKIIAAPLARRLGVETVLACGVAAVDGIHTDKISGLYCFGEGKVLAAREFCVAKGLTLDQAAYYGDGLPDIPILSAVGFPTAVNPGAKLEAVAKAKGWPIESWRR